MSTNHFYFFRLENPKHVVFDEMHYGKYASHYLKNTFFFDSNPPLGKMIVALAGYLAGFDGNFGFEKIGLEYPATVPLWTLRLVHSSPIWSINIHYFSEHKNLNEKKMARYITLKKKTQSH